MHGFRAVHSMKPCVKKEMQINAGGRIAQLLFPYIQSKAAPVERTRALGSTGKHGFGQTVVTDQRLVPFIWELNGQRWNRNSRLRLKISATHNPSNFFSFHDIQW